MKVSGFRDRGQVYLVFIVDRTTKSKLEWVATERK